MAESQKINWQMRRKSDAMASLRKDAWARPRIEATNIRIGMTGKPYSTLKRAILLVSGGVSVPPHAP